MNYLPSPLKTVYSLTLLVNYLPSLLKTVYSLTLLVNYMYLPSRLKTAYSLTLLILNIISEFSSYSPDNTVITNALCPKPPSLCSRFRPCGERPSLLRYKASCTIIHYLSRGKSLSMCVCVYVSMCV